MKLYLLAADDSMLIAYAFGALISILLLVWMLRIALKVSKTEAYQRSSIILMKEMALKAGVEEDKVESAMSYFRNSEK